MHSPLVYAIAGSMEVNSEEAFDSVRGATQTYWLCLNANDDLKGTSLHRVIQSQR